MQSVWDFLKQLTDPQSIIHVGGLALLLFVIFAETGLFIGFFLPGDSLVFIAGLLSATRPELLGASILIVLPALMAAAILGNITGYWFGRKVGERLYQRKDSFLFKQKHLQATRDFYERYGGRALIIGRFLPIIRTFAPILAGVIRVDARRFMLYNLIGAVAWIGSIGGAGYILGNSYPQTEDYLGYIVIGLIVITAIPVVRTYWKERRRNRDTTKPKP